MSADRVRIEKQRGGMGSTSYDLFVDGKYVGNYRLLADAKRVGRDRLLRTSEEQGQLWDTVRLENE